MKSKAFEAYGSCGDFAPNYITNGQELAKLSSKTMGDCLILRHFPY